MTEIDRRTMLATAPLLATVAVLPAAALAQAGAGVGEWIDGPLGLPGYRYTGSLTFGGKPMLPDDPWFLLGNHRVTIFAHASGRLRWLSGERGWAEMNGRGGVNGVRITIDGRTTELTGIAAPAAASAPKIFSPGSATYVYAPMDGVTVTRTLSVMPSVTAGKGLPALLVTVDLVNAGTDPVRITHEEAITADYARVAPPWSHNGERVRYERADTTAANGIARADFRAVARDPLLLPPRPHMAEFDGEPPSLWLTAGEGGTATIEADGTLTGRATLTLEPGARHRFRFVIGHAFASEVDAIRATATAMIPSRDAADHAATWRARVPTFYREADPQMRRELQWNAATLDAMATWREYYDETIVPQGTVYDYDWGWTASSRDLAQHALPLCTTRPAIARSTIRYIMKRMVPDGEIKLNDTGYGWAEHGPMLTSDQQLYLFMLVAEYLRVTGDLTVLTERIGFYPAEVSGSATGLDHLERAFLFLRDRIGTGAHGLVKLWNSDWNDLFYHWPTSRPYNETFNEAESHMNSAMAVVMLADLAAQLARHAPAKPLADAMMAYRAKILTAFMTDLGARTFPRRAYLGKAGVAGETEMWLEPQGFTLLIPELPVARKRALAAEIATRLGKGEALGARQIEARPAQSELKLGQRENGGFWYALNGPVILGLVTFDRTAADTALRRMTFAAYARRFPQYWTGAWTASDSLDATTVPTQGLSIFPPWCAHPHAWPLYLWLRLNG